MVRTFLEIVRLTLQDNQHHRKFWLLEAVLRDDPLIDIAKKYVEKDTFYDPNDGNVTTGLFYAYIHYKKSMQLNISEENVYKLLANAGIITQILKQIEEQTENDILDFITVRDIINYYEKTDDFWVWLSAIYLNNN
jgi:hypothetical protein